MSLLMFSAGSLLGCGGGGAAIGPAPSPNEGSVVEVSPNKFSPSEIEITPGAVITWSVNVVSNGIVFKDIAPEGGNIAESAVGTRASRRFTSAGEYDYYTTRDRDVNGRIRVK